MCGRIAVGWHSVASFLLISAVPDMATRQLRRLKEQLQAQEEPTGAPESDESVSGEDETPGKAPFNPFDLLSDDEVSIATGKLGRV